jgi:type I restriction enzyme S subunit
MKKYDNYKDSGIDWIGNIPKHWNLKKIGSLSECLTGFAFKSDNFSFEKGIKIVRGDNVTENSLRWGDKTRYWNEYSEVLDRFQLQKNDIVIGMDGSKVGKNYAYVQEKDLPLLLVQRVARIRSNDEVISKWIHFNIGDYNFKYYINLSKTDPAIPHITLKNITSYPICIPDNEELIQIIKYLDHKTTQIDTLISKKQQFITLLQEERIAVINQAVTKGLNPKVKMKDSGIEWLGEIPEHWGVKRIGHISKVIRGASPRPAGDPLLFNGDFLPWITVKEVTNANGKFITSTDTFLTELGAIQTRILEPETLILSNSGATLGVPRITLIKGGINDGSVAFLNLNIERDYMYYFFTTHTNIYREEAAGYGQPNLNTEIVKSTKIPIPTAKEQQEIIKYIELELNRFDLIISKSQQEIELLKEYKTALISEVVTGKVDVRNIN